MAGKRPSDRRISTQVIDPYLHAASLIGVGNVEVAASDIFEEEPVPLDVFIEDKKYLALPPLSAVQREFIEMGTTVYKPETFVQISWIIDRYVTELVAEWGKGSGKDHSCRVIAARAIYLLLCLKNPQQYFGMSPDSSIDIINVAYNATQANNVYFVPFRRLIKASPWFSDKFDDRVGFISFEKNLNAISGHSDQEGLEGYNLLIAVLDEISAFKTSMELRNRRSIRMASHSAEGIYDAMKSSVQSRFPGIGKTIMLSYPRYVGDFIEIKYEEGRNDPHTFVSFASTWEANPTRRREEFDIEFKKNPEKASAKYECKPPRAIDTYFRKPQFIDVAFNVEAFQMFEEVDENGEPIVQFDPAVHPIDYDNQLLSSYWCNDKFPRFIHVDAALSNDRAGFAMVHQSGWEIRLVEDQRPVRLPIVTVDLMTYWTAPADGEIELGGIRKLILDLRDRGFNIAKVTYDGYQSADSIQILSGAGIESDRRSVDKDTSAYDTLKDLIYDERLKGYYCWLVTEELKNLSIVAGSKVDHPDYGSKDVSDALAGAVQGAVEIGLEIKSQSRATPRTVSIRV